MCVHVCVQCERESVWLRMRLLTKRDCWIISSQRKEERAVKKRVAAVVERTKASIFLVVYRYLRHVPAE